MGPAYFSPRRYWSVLLIQSARGGLKTSRSTVSSIASALCGMCAGCKHFAGVHHDLLAVDPELQRAIEDVGELLVVMAVHRDDAAFLQQHPRHHDLLADHKLALQQRVQFFERDRMPRNVLQCGRSAACLVTARLARE